MIEIDRRSDPMRTRHLLSVDSQREILSHDTVLLNALHTALLESGAELLQRLVRVELGSEGKTSGPGKDRRDGVGRGLVALLMLSVVSGDGT